MLKHLLVENYALIEKLDIALEEGLTVITGETGAGKSIVLGALALILGQRADTGVLLHKHRKCIVEGTFSLQSIKIKDLFDKHQLDYDEPTTFRREITPQGKSRAFVNDTPVNLYAMKEIAERLIDIHSQHQNLLIGDSSFQFDVVDSFCGNLVAANAYKIAYKENQKKTERLFELEEQEKRARAELDYFKFQFEELDKARLNEEEFLNLEGELEILRHAGEIKFNLAKTSFVLGSADANVISGLNETIQLLKPLSRYNQKFSLLLQRLESLLIETKDLIADIDSESEKVVHDPARIQELQLRTDLLNKLLLKHNARSIAELEQVRNNYKEKISATYTLEDQINELRIELAELHKQLHQMAAEISAKRKNAKPDIEAQVTSLLRQLGMPGALFVVYCQNNPTLTINGLDKIDFLFSANPGNEPREIAKVASGGELSRLMLSIKSMISQRNLLPTIIFDEIDAGISGETATKVANILENIARNMQVLTITHLPQIASRGHYHLLVYKTMEQGKAFTGIKKIENQERILEVAKMLGGEKPTEVMLATARELIFNTVKN